MSDMPPRASAAHPNAARHPRRPHPPRLLLAALLAVNAASVLAQDDATGTTPTETPSTLEQLRPTGPVTLRADNAEWVEGGAMEYRGNVSLRSDNLKLLGSRMTVTQENDGQFRARIVGAPATLDHAAVAGAGDAASQAVSAQAGEIDYDSRSGIIHLSGGAKLTRGSDEVTGQTIDYAVAERRIRASGGGDSGQVRIVIQPPSAPPAEPTPAPEPAVQPEQRR